MPWNYKRYGSAHDPIHKSHLNSILGDYGCPKQFKYGMDAQADGVEGVDEQQTISGKAAAGTAAHETIARALSNLDMREHLLRGGKVSPGMVSRAFTEEVDREAGGRSLVWYGKDEDKSGAVLAERVTMVTALLNGLHEYVASIELLEPGFIYHLGEFWLSGHVDLIYRPKGRLAGVEPELVLGLSDWKTGKMKPAPIELDHGWEAGVYSGAVKQGYFFPREQIRTTHTAAGTVATCGTQKRVHPSKYIAERRVLEAAMIDFAERVESTWAADGGASTIESGAYQVKVFSQFPSEIFHVHLGDYVPYLRGGKKGVKRPEDLRFYGLPAPVKAHHYEAGDNKGPAWLPVQLTEYDLRRFEARLRGVVRSVRLGIFLDPVGERCTRCSYASDCLTSGYVQGDERKSLERALRGAASEDDAASLDD